MDALCDRYGIKMPMPGAMGPPERLDQSALFLAEHTPKSIPVSCYEQPQMGTVGTRIYAGRLVGSGTSEYTPTVVRGSGGSAGIYAEYRDSETMIYDPLVGISELVASAPPKVVMPKRIRRSQQLAVERWVHEQNAAIENFRCMEGGWRKFCTEAMSQACFGFSTFERIHTQLDNKTWVWSGAQPRLQATVNRWVQCADSDELVAVEYHSNNGYRTDKNTYVLPAVAPNPWDVRVLLFRLGGYGLDWEGTPPTRPSLHWVKFKRLIAQIIPAAAEKYGVPITYLKRDPAYMSMLMDGVAGSMADMQDAYNAFLDALAEDVPVHMFGDGIIAETIAPPGTMPTLESWIQYCDQMIAFPFSNEGNLMGLQSSSGSYAQAEVRERRFLRSAPYYQEAFTDPINEQIFKPLLKAQFGEMLEYPRLELSSSRFSDNSQWLVDARTLFGPNIPVEDWPESFRQMAYEKMGVQQNDIDVIEDQAPEVT